MPQATQAGAREGRRQMSTFIQVVVGLVVFAAAALAMRPVGRWLKSRHVTWTWAVGIVLVLVAVAVLTLAQVQGQDWMWGAGIGLGLGGLSGMRYGEGTLLSLLGGKGRGSGAPKTPRQGQ